MKVAEFLEDRASWLVELFPGIKASLIFHKSECANIIAIHPKGSFEDRLLMGRLIEVDSGFKQMFPDEFLVITDAWSRRDISPYTKLTGRNYLTQKK